MLTHLSQIQSDPLGFLIELLYTIPSVLIALTLHELGHGYAALRCGDHTAEMMGRLSFDPRRHLDPLGTASMLLIGVGWAKPVPVNPRNYKNPRRDDVIVSAAGITVNLCLFVIGTVLSVVCVRVMCPNETLEMISKYNDTSASRLLMRASLYSGEAIEEYLKGLAEYQMVEQAWLVYVLRFLGVFCSLNMGLAVFNLLPFPPLDGYRLANNLIFRGRWQLTPQVLRISMLALLVINYATNWLSYALYYAATGVQTALLWVLLPLFGMA